MRILLAGIAAIILTSGTASAQKYRHFNILTGGAYTDSEEAPDRWKVMGTADSLSDGQAAALYRAAEITAKAGSPAFRIVRQKVRLTTREYRALRKIEYRETAYLTIRAVRTPGDLTACEMPSAAQCMTLTVQDVMSRYGPELEQPTRPAQVIPALAFEVPHAAFQPKPVPRALPAYVPPAPAPMPVPVPVAVAKPIAVRPAMPAAQVAAREEKPGMTSWAPLPGAPAITPLPGQARPPRR
ncbi:hypothetical protein HZY97_10705 [Sphingomonas sp. R-74633]|uniref:hypothetical protein n=1 Tax=Sphingomonas sp. R-74633 TaxID=2751188 RepID=UPI0015D2FB89|nr:hypothetical protein [Sphingomonas sp. R-74633]NYT41228.1 hypothetical protein [Sphingomonas sp. R-74633]